MTNILERLVDDVGLALRHVLPGVLVLGTAYLWAPCWFSAWGASLDGWQMTTLGVVAIAVGNLAYVLNRYGVIAGVEFVAFLLRSILADWLPRKYANRVAAEMEGYYGYNADKLRGLIKFRDSAVVYLLIAAEASFVLSFSACPLNSLHLFLRYGSLACVVAALWTYLINRLVVRKIFNVRG